MRIILFLLILLPINTALALDFGDYEKEFVDYEIMGKMLLDAEFLDGDILKISGIAQDIKAPVLGLAFHLKYDENKLAFLRYDPGDFLERGGDPFYLVTRDLTGGRLIFGETLRRDDSFPVGGGVVSDFYFQILGGEEFAFNFENGVISTLDTVRQDIDKVVWEDLYIDKNGGILSTNVSGEDYSVIDSMRLESSNFNVSRKAMLIVSICLSVGVLLALVFMIKMRGKKRHTTSVNF